MASGSNPKSLQLPRLQSPEQRRLEAWVQLVCTHTRMLKLVEQTLATEGVTLPQFDVLSILRLQEGLTQQELAARLQSTKGNVCGLLDRLEKLKWVERRPDARDGRTNRLHLTTAGRSRVEELRPIHDRLILRLMKNLSSEAIDALQQSAIQLDAAADAEMKRNS